MLIQVEYRSARGRNRAARLDYSLWQTEWSLYPEVGHLSRQIESQIRKVLRECIIPAFMSPGEWMRGLRRVSARREV